MALRSPRGDGVLAFACCCGNFEGGGGGDDELLTVWWHAKSARRSAKFRQQQRCGPEDGGQSAEQVREVSRSADHALRRPPAESQGRRTRSKSGELPFAKMGYTVRIAVQLYVWPAVSGRDF